ncbi:MAG: RecQ family ATP-dependent DNA helicase, partial [Bacteroidetes bacterium]|nr:RecQ family ATP-dependent DNA helicase [Bacteroidota bacterium]
MIDKADSILKKIFGYDNFRPLQREIIHHVLSKKDSLVIMPTGGGKSLCYQIPALIFDGLTVVVSPLISLMKDQVEQLREYGVHAIFLNSSLSPEDYRANEEKIRNNKVKLLYVAPETLAMEKTLDLLSSVKLDCLTIDEAHCISEWGHDFRPEYRQLAEIKSHFPEAVSVALTATATPRVQEDIIKNLNVNLIKKETQEIDLSRYLNKLIWHHDEPLISSSMLGGYLVYKLVKEGGVTVALDGQGADELLGGYQKHIPYLFFIDQLLCLNHRNLFSQIKINS